jgi:hypothetical protein
MDGNQTPAGQPELPQPIQPGQTISPGAAQSSPPAEVSSPSLLPSPAQQPPAPIASPVAPVEVPEPTQQPDATPGFMPPANDYEEYASAPGSAVSWTASEFIAHEKAANWYILLFGGAIIVAGLTWLILKDIIAAAVILIAAIMLAAYSKRQPRELAYSVDDSGITIGQKHYPYTLFRSFSIIDEGAFSSIELMPLKRFSPAITVYFDPANEDAIAEALAPHVPFVPRKPDPVDQLIRRIRF